MVMSRLRRIAECDRVFFLTTNLANGVTPLTAAERDVVLRAIDESRNSSDVLILGYVVMPDHVHLLVACRAESISKVMHQWKFKSGFSIQKLRGAKGPLWQARYFDFICRRNRDVSDKLRYIHENPVSAGLVRQSDAWPWSSASHYAQTAVPSLVPDRMEFSGDPNTLLWPAPWRSL